MRRELPQVLRRGSALLHQQCWLWGCDIRRSEGNLLLTYGFARQADLEGKRSTQYTLPLEHCSIVRLWGSGFYFGSVEEGVFLNRFAFEPRLVRFTEDWQDPVRLKEAPRYMDFQRLSAACGWIAEYEMWALLQFGKAYRRTCLLSGPDPAQEVEGIAATWRQLAKELAAFC
ncbi:hypothetical protein [Terriglobus sp. RCC_193]|uniref:hypothetical protein n=1 Tax=Terriglobus sp. RCC_193 TaxID=3239218 RepID=UPI00352561FB